MKMKMVVLLAPLCALLCIGEKSALAEPGLKCVAESPGTVAYAANAEARNPSSSGYYYSCPFSPFYGRNRTIWVYDGHSTQDITCVTRRINDQGTITWTSGSRTSAGTGLQSLTWNTDPPGGSGSTYTYSCYLPPYAGNWSRIYSYTWD
jgi:hypothetical protein